MKNHKARKKVSKKKKNNVNPHQLFKPMIQNIRPKVHYLKKS